MPYKKEYKMLSEIFEQPEVIRKLIEKHIKNNQVVFPEFTVQADKIKRIKRVTFLGCGTSYHAAIYGNYLFEDLTGLPGECEYADEFIKRKAVVEPGTAVVIISQSGRTTDAVKAAEIAKKHKALVIAVTNDANSKLAKLSDLVIDTAAGKELAIAATKTFTAQLFSIVLFTLYMAGVLGKSGQKRKKIIQAIKLIPKLMEKILSTEKEIKKLAIKYKKNKNFAVIGEKWNYPVALEGALKLMETNSIEVEGFPTGEFKHGPISIVKKNFPVIFAAPQDSTYKKNLEIMKAAKKAGGRVILITSALKKEKTADSIVTIPKIFEPLYPALSVLPLQLFAFHLAVSKGFKVDKPRNLKKFVK